jgi:hypothetical protein
MDHVLSLKKLVRSDMDQTGGFSYPFSGGDDSDISFSNAAMEGLFQNPQRAFID